MMLGQQITKNTYGPLLEYFQNSSSNNHSWELAGILIDMWPVFVAMLLLSFLVYRWLPDLVDTYGERYFEVATPDARSIWGRFSAVCCLNLLLCISLLLLPMNTSFYLALIFTSLYGVILLDVKFQVIPDRLHLVGLIGALGFLATTNNFTLIEEFSFWTNRVVYACLVPFILILMNFLYDKLKGEQPLGLGDIKLLAWLSLLVGDAIFGCFTLGLMICCFWTIPRLVLGKVGLDSRFAFGPFIVAGVGLQMIWNYGSMLNFLI